MPKTTIIEQINSAKMTRAKLAEFPSPIGSGKLFLIVEYFVILGSPCPMAIVKPNEILKKKKTDVM